MSLGMQLDNDSIAELVSSLRAHIIALAKIAVNKEYRDNVRAIAYDRLSNCEQLVDALIVDYDLEEELKNVQSFLEEALQMAIDAVVVAEENDKGEDDDG